MSERGSFVTEYVYCPKCFEVLKTVLLGNDKYLKSEVVPSWESDRRLPIIAGKIGGLYGGEELDEMEHKYGLEIEAGICHPVRLAVLAEDGERIFRFEPTVAHDTVEEGQ